MKALEKGMQPPSWTTELPKSYQMRITVSFFFSLAKQISNVLLVKQAILVLLTHNTIRNITGMSVHRCQISIITIKTHFHILSIKMARLGISLKKMLFTFFSKYISTKINKTL